MHAAGTLSSGTPRRHCRSPTSYHILRQSTYIDMRRSKNKASQTLRKLFKTSSSRSESTPSNVGRTSLQPEPDEQPVVQRVSGEHDTIPTTGTTLGGVDKADLDQAGRALSSLKTLGKHVTKALQSIDLTTKHVKSSYELWEPLLEKVQVFASLVEKIGGIHPYAKIASTVLLSVVKPVIAQDKRDKAMADLFVSMYDLYDFVVEAGRLPELDKKRLKLLKNMSMQTAECAYFIRDKAQVENFWVRAGKNAVFGPQIDSKIAEFTEAFKDLRCCFTEHGVLEIEIKLAILEDIRVTVELSALADVPGAGLDAEKACLEGTRQQTLNELIDWINDPQAPAVCFLLGGAGTGKSSIAHSVGNIFSPFRRLGFFCFDRSFQNRHPNLMFSTIARDLAEQNADFRGALAEVLREQQPELKRSMNIASHWNSLILTPLKRFPPAGPVLVVIDAFDECSSSRDLLLKLVTGSSGSLPPNLRILVTSRPERDVRVAMRCAHSDHLRSMDLDEKNGEARLDIEYYIRHQLTSDEPHIDGTLDDRDFQELANESEGLFQWAATVCRAINHKPAGRTLKERFRRRPRAAQGKEYPLDPLYKQVLGNLFKSEDAELMDRFRSVMAQILCTPFPISTQLTDELRRIATGVQESKVTLIVADMGPLLSGVSARTSPIRPLHTSFRDFLTDAARSGEWFVDLARGHSIMALGCLRVMNNRLAFNICRLETSYILNRDIPDLDSRLSTYVPQSLLYAACNWKDHLASTHPSDLQQELSMFLRERLLFWFELLSLLKCV
ncbi:hypothetical protein BD311DRAFT_702123, partial [Dichomitus squalens]